VDPGGRTGNIARAGDHPRRPVRVARGGASGGSCGRGNGDFQPRLVGLDRQDGFAGGAHNLWRFPERHSGGDQKQCCESHSASVPSEFARPD